MRARGVPSSANLIQIERLESFRSANGGRSVPRAPAQIRQTSGVAWRAHEHHPTPPPPSTAYSPQLPEMAYAYMVSGGCAAATLCEGRSEVAEEDERRRVQGTMKRISLSIPKTERRVKRKVTSVQTELMQHRCAKRTHRINLGA